MKRQRLPLSKLVSYSKLCRNASLFSRSARIFVHCELRPNIILLFSLMTTKRWLSDSFSRFLSFFAFSICKQVTVNTIKLSNQASSLHTLFAEIDLMEFFDLYLQIVGVHAVDGLLFDCVLEFCCHLCRCSNWIRLLELYLTLSTRS